MQSYFLLRDYNHGPTRIYQKLAELAGGNPAQSFSDEIIAGTAVPSTMDKLAGNGIEASQWGGLFINLIVATAGCVLGFGIGVVLAFGGKVNYHYSRSHLLC